MGIQRRSEKKEFHKYVDLFVDRWVSKGCLEKEFQRYVDFFVDRWVSKGGLENKKIKKIL